MELLVLLETNEEFEPDDEGLDDCMDEEHFTCDDLDDWTKADRQLEGPRS